MKTIFIFLTALILSISLAFAFPVDLSYTDSSTDGKPIVADVPFDITVAMNTNSNDVLSYNLYITSTDARAKFTSASRETLFPNNDLDASSGAQSANTIYRYQVKPKVGYVGNSAGRAASIFNLRTRIPGVTPSTVELKRDGMIIHADNVITPAASGASIDAINDATITITPVLSICSDGVVGYIDSNSDGIKQDAEVQEACDEGSTNSIAGGCSATCTYIDLGYSCTNTQFGNRGSVCNRLTSTEFLIQKLTALINGQCYPSCTHPAALYVDATVPVAAGSSPTPRITYDLREKLDLSEKIYMIAQIGVALREFFSQTISAPAAPPAGSPQPGP